MIKQIQRIKKQNYTKRNHHEKCPIYINVGYTKEAISESVYHIKNRVTH